MTEISVFLLILLSLAIGFFLGKRAAVKNNDDSLPQARYVKGLNYLLAEESDEGLDHFLSDMEVNAETLDLHLTLGKMLRNKGELERAIKVHLNLISRPGLSLNHHHAAQIELAQDYVQFGLLDRAETLLSELIDDSKVDKGMREQVLVKLIRVYEDTHDWLKAIDIADRLTKKKFAAQSDSWREAQAHYACELAEEALTRNAWMEVRRWLSAALRYDKNCIRACLIQARVDMEDGRFPVALASLKGIPKQNPKLASEMIEPLVEVYEHFQDKNSLRSELESYLESQNDIRALKYLAEFLFREEGVDALLEMLEKFLPRYPKLAAAEQLIAALKKNSGQFADFRSTLDKFLDIPLQYQCESCGFRGSHNHWLCPSCKQWASMSLR